MLIAVTLAIHAAGCALIAIVLVRMRFGVRFRRWFLHSWVGAVTAIALVGIALALLHGLEATLWALAYLYLGALPTPADALLYSVDSMVTRGASGLTLSSRWAMMGALEAADGMLLFGISTALLVMVMQRTFQNALSAMQQP